LTQVSRALEVMVVLVTACGVLLLLAQVQVGMRQRHQELVVWRTLGAGKSLLRTTLWAEFALLGVVSGWWRPSARRWRWRCCKPKCLIFRGRRTGDCG
jgi:putative ABC transport system permease protein